MNGTLYDPQDVSRFDDTDLDFFASGDRLLAFDDRSLLDNWLQNSQLTAQISANYTSTDVMTMKAESSGSGVTTRPETGGSGGFAVAPGGTTNREHTGTVSSALLGPMGPPVWVPDYIPHTNFYEHAGNDGARLELRADTEYTDLTDVSMGVFSGNWNDEISSVQFVAMDYALLGEDVGWGGARIVLHFQQDTRNLSVFGWNDRASAVLTWGPQQVPGHITIPIGNSGPFGGPAG